MNPAGVRVRALFLLAAAALPAQQVWRVPAGETTKGAALGDGVLYTWGRMLLAWPVAGGAPTTIATSLSSGYGEGGCVDRESVVLQDGLPLGDLVRIASDGTRTVLDTDVEMHDCVATELFGRRGILIIHRYAQVRFYHSGGMREIYSFYTASRQAGLLVRDVDGDGNPDVIAGNYWIRNPGRFELPWRLFAINTRHDHPAAATFRLVWTGRDLVAAQGETQAGGVFAYSPPADPTALWTERAVATLRFPHALASTPAGIVAGENAGYGSKVMLIGDGTRQLGATDGAHTAIAAGDRVALCGPRRITWFSVRSTP